MSFAVGSLVKARGREWVVLPESEDDLLVVRPLGGTEDEIAGILTALETVEPAQFALPDPGQIGDYQSSLLLRDAVRLGFRSSAGPFRSFARIAVEPRPYQLVPLLLALKMDPVRLLIADDVGIGKTIEAALIARELLDRGEIKGFTVLCPPHLAEQWQVELSSKFHIYTQLVLASTAARLERQRTSIDETIFDLFPITIVSTDFIKTERRADDFVRRCPDLVIVDEAHTCTWSGAGRGGRQQRHSLIQKLSAKGKHLILVTATPHSGNDDAFRSLLGLLKPEFANLAEDLAGPSHADDRRKLADHLVQRRRADIRHYLDSATFFPNRQEAEETYRLSAAYRVLFEKVLKYARETALDETGGSQKQRIRWWSALSLLRSIASSPMAAHATLNTRSRTADSDDIGEIDEIGRLEVLDLNSDDSLQVTDTAPGADPGDLAEAGFGSRSRLSQMAKEALALCGDGDEKLLKVVTLLKALLKDGYNPIVFCRYIPTAEYVATELRKRLGKGIEIADVTGLLPPAEREERVQQLGLAERRILVCTDCLSEGVNLQEQFDAVIHYDLAWNPTRHEQREGRVDRYGQPKDNVRVVTYYSKDTQIDGIVLEVLLRKHNTIRKSLGISVPAPSDTNAVVEAMMDGLILRGKATYTDGQLSLFGEESDNQRKTLNLEWENAADREKRNRTLFAQASVDPNAVVLELNAARDAVGSHTDIARFMRDAVVMSGGTASREDSPAKFDLDGTSLAFIEAAGDNKRFAARYEMPVRSGEILLHRTHPIVEGIASYILDTTLDSLTTKPVASRCGVIRTASVTTRTTVLLLRFRYHIVTRQGDHEWPLLAEDVGLAAFEGRPGSARWLDDADAELLLAAIPAGNVAREQSQAFVAQVVEGFDALLPHIDTILDARGAALLESHRRVRDAVRQKGITYRIEPQRPADVLGIYIALPPLV